MSQRSDDDSVSLGHPLAEATTDVLVESGSDDSAGGEDSGEEALAKLGLEARAELERLRARLGLLDGDGEGDDDGDDGDEEPAGPRVVGRYRLLERIGHGGMGVVYRAHDPELGRAVAIKLVYAPAFAAPEKLRSRLLREAKLLAKLAHPNVVRVYDCGQHEGEVYLAMEHVQGTTLRAWQTAGPRTPVAIVDAYVAAAAGLAAAHDLGIVHRDFKPDNVLVADDGGILVGDFGLAVGGVDEVRPVEADDEGEPQPVPAGPLAAMTKTGALLGTVLYMAPEQLRGEPATASSDQFAFCVALWEALAGRRPFEGDEQAGLLAAIEKGRPAGGDRIPKKLRRALERGLSLDPADRYPNVRMLAAALRGRRGPSMGVALTVVGASIGLGLLAYPLMFVSAPPAEECGLERGRGARAPRAAPGAARSGGTDALQAHHSGRRGAAAAFAVVGREPRIVAGDCRWPCDR
jgi:predicted Ser/Thr protein kinase